VYFVKVLRAEQAPPESDEEEILSSLGYLTDALHV
jgi:hypothetical protein